jgi:Flp pilus assembly pilin Flp
VKTVMGGVLARAPDLGRLTRALVALVKDERGLTTVEYSAAGGVLSAMIFVAASALRDAQAEAVASMFDHD